jgi:hypothetical protein
MPAEWNIEEALAWVFWRNMAVVHAMKNDSLAAMLMWPPDKEGRGSTRFGGKVIPRLGKKNDLLAALRQGHLTARGRRNGVGDRATLTPEQWGDLAFDISALRGTCAVPEDGPNKGAFWNDFRLSIQEVRGYFPEPGKRRKSKTKGAGDGSIDDKALVSEMRKMIQKHSHSVLAAAKRVAPKAAGAGTIESKIRRLTRKYKDKYSR